MPKMPLLTAKAAVLLAENHGVIPIPQTPMKSVGPAKGGGKLRRVFSLTATAQISSPPATPYTPETLVEPINTDLDHATLLEPHAPQPVDDQKPFDYFEDFIALFAGSASAGHQEDWQQQHQGMPHLQTIKVTPPSQLAIHYISPHHVTDSNF